MSNAQSLTVPHTKDVLAAYSYASGSLVACPDQKDASTHYEAAQTTFAAWTAVQALPGAAAMMIKADKHVSLCLATGGLVIEGRDKLNVGLMRAAAKKFNPIKHQPTKLPRIQDTDRFRQSFWAILERLSNTVIPRTFMFDLAGTSGTIHVQDGALRFGGDFDNPQSFIGELKAACEISEDVQYSIAPRMSEPEGAEYSVVDLVHEIAKLSEPGMYEFDANGWPIGCPPDADISFIKALATGAKLISSHDAATMTVLSSQNAPILSGKLTSSTSVRFKCEINDRAD